MDLQELVMAVVRRTNRTPEEVMQELVRSPEDSVARCVYETLVDEIEGLRTRVLDLQYDLDMERRKSA